ncbi:MAG: hypothetical protein WBB45_10805 [Cyclobacteriaceae bacterium]
MKPEHPYSDNKEKKLEGHDGSAPFHVPEGYFTSLQDRIMDKVGEEPSANMPAKKGRLTHIARFVIPALAASLLAIALWVWQIGDASEQPGSEALLAGLTDQEMIDYLNDSSLDVEEIAYEVPDVVPEEVEILPDAGEIPDDIWEEEILYGDLYDVI